MFVLHLQTSPAPVCRTARSYGQYGPPARISNAPSPPAGRRRRAVQRPHIASMHHAGLQLYSATNVSVTSEFTVTVYSVPGSKSEPSGTVVSTMG